MYLSQQDRGLEACEDVSCLREGRRQGCFHRSQRLLLAGSCQSPAAAIGPECAKTPRQTLALASENLIARENHEAVKPCSYRSTLAQSRRTSAWQPEYEPPKQRCETTLKLSFMEYEMTSPS